MLNTVFIEGTGPVRNLIRMTANSIDAVGPEVVYISYITSTLAHALFELISACWKTDTEWMHKRLLSTQWTQALCFLVSCV
jgi:hypothetical protein